MVSTSDNYVSPPPLTPPPPVNSSGGGQYSSISYNPSLLIIAAIIAFVCIASASIHLLLRFLSRHSGSSSLLIHRNASSSSAETTSSSSSTAASTDKDRKALLDSLPLFSLASSMAALPKSSPDCAVCLSRFTPHDELRLLPACRHAFHSSCIDAWLSSATSCPLCRCPIDLPPAPQAVSAPPTAAGSESFRVEIGSVSRHGAPAERQEDYSLGSSFEYRVQDEVEAVVARVRRRVEDAKDQEAGPAPPGAEVAEAAGGGSRGWLKEYVDRLASSSFSSLRFSSRRFDSGREGSWDFEGDGGGEEEGRRSAASSYRWLTGAI